MNVASASKAILTFFCQNKWVVRCCMVRDPQW
jgi:hypothetical protein